MNILHNLFLLFVVSIYFSNQLSGLTQVSKYILHFMGMRAKNELMNDIVATKAKTETERESRTGDANNQIDRDRFEGADKAETPFAVGTDSDSTRL